MLQKFLQLFQPKRYPPKVLNYGSRCIRQYPNGYTIKEAKQFLEENTHCGIYWHVKAKHDRKAESVYVYMAGNETVTLHLPTGTITRDDWD